MPDSLERLDLLLLTVARKRKVHPDSIRYQRLRYVDTTLAAYIGESVTLRYDPRDMAEIRVFHQEHSGTKHKTGTREEVKHEGTYLNIGHDC
jgi:putative transposase